jgi:hypothetical protein
MRRGIGEKRSIHFQGMSTFSRASGRLPQGCRPPPPRGPENVVQNLSRSARLTLVMVARNGEAKADIAAKNPECLNEEIKIQGAAPKFATSNVGRLDRADHVSCASKAPRGGADARGRVPLRPRCCSLTNRPRGTGRDPLRSWRPRSLLGLRQDGLSSPMVAIPPGRAKRKWREDRR